MCLILFHSVDAYGSRLNLKLWFILAKTVQIVFVINPRRACAARDTVVTLSVCLSVPSISHWLDVQE